MPTVDPTIQPIASERKDRRTVVIRAAIASLALLGLGGAITTAAWTDQVFFSAPATAATFDLKASLTQNGTFEQHQTSGDALLIPIPTSQFGDLVPGSTPQTVTVYVRNDSTVDADLSVSTTTTGDLFKAPTTTVSVDAQLAQPTVAPGATDELEITLTPGAMPDSLQGASGTVLVSVTGTTK
jgi:predicted ribosomally synthesized peptide with SipW-like signal peptide